jgi:hypothetical protein
MTPKDRLRHISAWLADLAQLTHVGADDRAMREKIALYASLLEHHTDAFCAASLASIAPQFKFFPSFAELSAALSAWYRELQDTTRALPAPAGDRRLQLTAVETLWLKRFHKHEAEGFANAGGPRNVSGRDHMLGLLKHHAHGAWLLVGGGAAAVQADWRDAENVAQSVRGILAPMSDGSDPPPGSITVCLTLLRGLVEKHAPENLHLVPDPPPLRKEPTRPGMQRRGGALPPAILDAMRQGAPTP